MTRSYFLGGTARLMLARGLGLALQVGVSLGVGTLVGSAALGLLQICQTWTAALGEFFARGAPPVAMRLHAQRNGVEGRSTAYLRFALRAATRLWTVGLLGLVLTCFWHWYKGDSPTSQAAIAVGIALSLFAALTRIGSDALRGKGRPLVAVVAENVVPPATLLIGIALSVLMGWEVTAFRMLGWYALGLIVAFGALAPLLNLSAHSAACRGRPGPEPDQRSLWVASVVNMLFLGLPFLLWNPRASLAEAGAFALAFKLVNVATTILLVLASIFGPRFARASRVDEAGAIRELLAQSQRWSLGIYLPLIAAVLLATPWLMAYLGAEFNNLALYVTVLAAGNLVHAAGGLPGLYLNMSGRGDLEMRAGVTCLALTVLAILWVQPSGLQMAMIYSGAVAAKKWLSLILARRQLLQPSKPFTREVHP